MDISTQNFLDAQGKNKGSILDLLLPEVCGWQTTAFQRDEMSSPEKLGSLKHLISHFLSVFCSQWLRMDDTLSAVPFHIGGSRLMKP